MQPKIIGLYYDPNSDTPLKKTTSIFQKILRKYHTAIQWRSNPRPEDYMRLLFESQCEGSEFISLKTSSDTPDLKDYDQVILLYPDSIGLGFSKLEKHCLTNTSNGTDIMALNGRKRLFKLDTKTLYRLRFKRFIERSLLPELLFMAVFIIITPFLWAIDSLRGRA